MTRWLQLGLLTAWCLAVALGIGKLQQYENTPGLAAHPEAQWPLRDLLPRPGGGGTLVLLAHPRCPCTRASLHELARILAHSHRPLTTYVFFYRPKGAPAGWEKTDLYTQATAIPGVSVRSDEGGASAQRFHATTSGQVLFYDGDRRLQFRGGITGGRGHEGDNAGEQTLTALLAGQEAKQAPTLVFGCSLQGPLSAY